MEITDREDLGRNLLAPATDVNGRESFSYSLVNWVREGDVVFHWWSRASPPSLVGRSVVAGSPFQSKITWASHSQGGGSVRTSKAFEAPLTDFVYLDVAYDLSFLRDLEAELREVRDTVQSTVEGPLYFPWVFSDRRPMRTAQAYLVKLPQLVFERLGLESFIPAPGPGEKSYNGDNGGRGARREQDPRLRAAIERYAVDCAITHFEELGCEVTDVGANRPYDLHVVQPDDREIHVEVKGSRSFAREIELTAGEVKHWGSDYERALVVVDLIVVEEVNDGYELSGGRTRVWRDWSIAPESDRLIPTRFRYLIED